MSYVSESVIVPLRFDPSKTNDVKWPCGMYIQRRRGAGDERKKAFKYSGAYFGTPRHLYF